MDTEFLQQSNKYTSQLLTEGLLKRIRIKVSKIGHNKLGNHEKENHHNQKDSSELNVPEKEESTCVIEEPASDLLGDSTHSSTDLDVDDAVEPDGNLLKLGTDQSGELFRIPGPPCNPRLMHSLTSDHAQIDLDLEDNDENLEIMKFMAPAEQTSNRIMNCTDQLIEIDLISDNNSHTGHSSIAQSIKDELEGQTITNINVLSKGNIPSPSNILTDDIFTSFNWFQNNSCSNTESSSRRDTSVGENIILKKQNGISNYNKNPDSVMSDIIDLQKHDVTSPTSAISTTDESNTTDSHQLSKEDRSMDGTAGTDSSGTYVKSSEADKTTSTGRCGRLPESTEKPKNVTEQTKKSEIQKIQSSANKKSHFFEVVPEKSHSKKNQFSNVFSLLFHMRLKRGNGGDDTEPLVEEDTIDDLIKSEDKHKEQNGICHVNKSDKINTQCKTSTNKKKGKRKDTFRAGRSMKKVIDKAVRNIGYGFSYLVVDTSDASSKDSQNYCEISGLMEDLQCSMVSDKKLRKSLKKNIITLDS